MHMPHIDLMQSEAVLGLSPHQQSLVCTTLLLAINWLRELLNAWAHHVQPTEYAAPLSTIAFDVGQPAS